MKTRTSKKIGKEEKEASFNAEIATEQNRFLSDVSLTAQQKGLSTAPLMEQADAYFSELKARVKLWLGTHITEFRALVEQFRMEDLRHAFHERYEKIQQELKPLLIDVKRIKLDYPWNQRNKWIAAICVICATDALLNFRSFQVVVSNLFFAIIVAVVTVAALALGAHIIGKKVREATTNRKKWIWLLAGILGGAVFFFVLGLFRLAFYGAEGGVVANPFLWAIWNSFFFALAIYISATYLPTQRQIDEKLRRDNIQKEIDRLNKEAQKLQQDMQKAEKEYSEIVDDLEDINKYQNDKLTQLDAQRDLMKRTLLSEFHLKGGKSSTEMETI